MSKDNEKDITDSYPELKQFEQVDLSELYLWDDYTIEDDENE